MGCNIPRPTKRPPTPPISDQPYGSKTDEAVMKAFDQFHAAAHDLTYHDTDRDQTIKERMTNCPNCCATITGSICEYCGTRFPWIQDAVTIPININGKIIDEVAKGMKANPARFIDPPELPIQEQR